jgi:acetylglutamate kinase
MTTVTIKVGGSLLADPARLSALVDQVQTLRGARARPLLVHGGGPQITRALRAEGFELPRHEGLRVTPPAAAQVVRYELDALGKELAARLAREGLPVFHADSHQERLSATPKEADVDLGRVGEPVGFDAVGLPGPVGGPVPIATPVGWDPEGPLNVNADEAAACIAAAVASDKLVFATDVDGVQGADGVPLDRLTPDRATALVDEGVVSGGMIPKVQAAREALDAGVRWAAIADPLVGLPAARGASSSSGTSITGRPEVSA